MLPNSPGGTPETHLPSESSKKKPTVLIVIIAILGLLLVLLGIAGCSAYQNNQLRRQVSQKLTTQPTAAPAPISLTKPETTTPPIAKRVLTDWKIYEDPKYGFKFDNPGQYVLEVDPEYDRVRLYNPLDLKWAAELEAKGIPVISIPFIEIASYENHERLSSLDWFKKYDAPNSFSPIESYEIIQIAGIDAVRYFGPEEGGGYTTILANDNYVIILADTTGIPQQDFELFISTFSLL